MSGYARIHRSLIGHPAFRNDAEAMAFAYLVLRASWEPTRVRYKGKAIDLSRGQLAISVRDLADAMDRDKGWIERLLKRLKSETMVETRAETGVMVVTICNYDNYQAVSDDSKTPRKTRGETRARQTQDTEQRREEGNKEDIVVVSAREFSLPDDIPADLFAEFEAMRNRIRKPLTDHGRRLAVDRLHELAADGWPPGQVLNHSILNNYQGLFPPKEIRNGKRPANDRRHSRADEIDHALDTLGFGGGLLGRSASQGSA